MQIARPPDKQRLLDALSRRFTGQVPFFECYVARNIVDCVMGRAMGGNIDVGSVLTRGTPEDVRRDTIEHIERLSPGGGYICGSSHDITEGVPFENFRALAETVCGFRTN